MYIYYTKGRENRTEFTNSYFGLLHANYEHVVNNSQLIDHQLFTTYIIKTASLFPNIILKKGYNRTSIIP